MLRGTMYLGLIFMMIEGSSHTFASPSEIREDNELPSFSKTTCPNNYGSDLLCIKVTFASGHADILILHKDSEVSSIYEGYIAGDPDVLVTMIDSPEEKELLFQFNSDKVPHCSMFGLSLDTNVVTCVTGGFVDDDEADRSISKDRKLPGESEGDIVPLDKYFGKDGLTIKVHFIFDKKFNDAFHDKEGKSGEQRMDEVMRLVKNIYKDQSLSKELKTTINLVTTKRKHEQELWTAWPPCWYNHETCDPSPEQFKAGKLYKMAEAEKVDFDLLAFVTHPGNAGVAEKKQICNDVKGMKISFNRAYGPNSCQDFNPPKPIPCTVTNRVALTAQTIAHEIGHGLGMEHDFDDNHKQITGDYRYKKYKGKTCRGLMDYIDDGVGWSQCSARDFSRHVTGGGTLALPCVGTSCKNKCKRGPAGKREPGEECWCQANNLDKCKDEGWKDETMGWVGSAKIFREDCPLICNTCGKQSTPDATTTTAKPDSKTTSSSTCVDKKLPECRDIEENWPKCETDESVKKNCPKMCAICFDF